MTTAPVLAELSTGDVFAINIIFSAARTHLTNEVGEECSAKQRLQMSRQKTGGDDLKLASRWMHVARCGGELTSF